MPSAHKTFRLKIISHVKSKYFATFDQRKRLNKGDDRGDLNNVGSIWDKSRLEALLYLASEIVTLSAF